MKTAPLGEIAKIVSGATPKTGVAEYWDGDVQWATPADLSKLNGPYISETPRKLTAIGVRCCATTVLPAGSVLLSSRAPIGHVAINTVPMATNQGFKSLVPGPDLDAKYLYHWLKSKTGYLQSLGNGATFKELSKKTTEQIAVPLPSLPEQRRIAAILDHADALRAKRRQVLTYLDALTQSIFQSTIGATSWPVEKLGERLEFLTSGSRGWAKYYVPSGAKFIRIQNVNSGYLNQDDMAYVAAPPTAEAKRTAVREGDVLLSITADLGRTAVIPDGIGVAYINQHLAILRAPSLDPRYLADFLASPAGRREVLGKDRGATKAGLNFDDVRSVAVPIPPKEIQRSYASRVARVNTQRATVQRAIAAEEELFASLRSRAFRGEL